MLANDIQNLRDTIDNLAQSKNKLQDEIEQYHRTEKIQMQDQHKYEEEISRMKLDKDNLK